MGTIAPEQEQTLSEEYMHIEEFMPYEEEDDGKEHRTHIVMAGDNPHISEGDDLDALQIVDIARMRGDEVIALCGYKWVPKRNPEKYPLCNGCMKMWGEMISSDGS